jgi:hypothetical protein
VYFVQRYYKNRPIKELAIIAAHAVLLGERMNSGSVGGIDVLLCQHNGFHLLSDDSIAALKTQTERFDGECEQLLLALVQQFTYVPDAIL